MESRNQQIAALSETERRMTYETMGGAIYTLRVHFAGGIPCREWKVYGPHLASAYSAAQRRFQSIERYELIAVQYAPRRNEIEDVSWVGWDAHAAA